MPENTRESGPPPTYKILSNPNQREVIKRRAIDLAHSARSAQTVIFLDRSARPLAHLMRQVFPIVYPDAELPKIKFLNIGSEKKEPKEIESAISHIAANDDLSPLKTLDDLKTIYGAENIDDLQKVLKSSDKPENRLVVDEVVFSKGTKTLTERILGIADPANTYSFFPFLDSPEDERPFRTGVGHTSVPWVPWSGASPLTKGEDGSDLSFTLSGEFSKSGRDEIMRINSEFRMLAEEIRKDTIR